MELYCRANNMIESRVYRCLFLFTILATIKQIHPSLHGHNNAFVQDGNGDVQYLLDSLPISMQKGFPNSIHGSSGDTGLEDGLQNSFSHIEFKPNILDFKERQLGVPHQETVTLFNRDGNRTIHLSSISGNTQHFHSSFFQDKVIPPLGNTTFNVVFLGREEGEIDSYLFIHTSDGTLKYQVKGISVSSPYRLRPVVGVKLPINASFTPLIYMHNPHPEVMQIVEVYSSGREFHLELPSGEVEGPRELWEIPPYQTKPVIRLQFNAYSEKNHTAYIRFRVNNSAEILIVAVEIEVISGAGLHWGGSSGINFGMGGSLDPPVPYHIVLKNSAKKPIKIQNIISTPSSKALKINFEPVVIPGDTEIPVTVGTLVYDWKAGLDLKHFKGKLLIKGVGPSGSSQKLTIPWIAQVFQGGLEFNSSAAHYCSPHFLQPRNFTIINKFKLPLAITNVSLASEAASLFTISNFVPKILQPGLRDDIFTLSLVKRYENLQLDSSLFIYSNISLTRVPLLSYNGKLRRIIPGERESDKGTMNFGTVSSGTENEGIFALENNNPVSIELHGWGVNMPGAVLELMGCQNGPTEMFIKGIKNITACSLTGNQNIKPGFLAVFKIKVKSPYVEEDTIIGDVFVKTTYERLAIPVYMRVAHGKLSINKLEFTECFPGCICLQQINVHSTFSKTMQVTWVAPLYKEERVKYIPLEDTQYPIISYGDNYIGSIMLDPSISCKQNCHLGLPLDTNVGAQWLNTCSLPSHTRDTDLNLLDTRYNRYLNLTSNGSWDNITMQLDSTQVRGHKFSVNIKPHWPSLIERFSDANNSSLTIFPLTQVGNTTYKTITFFNPTEFPLVIHLVMDSNYPQGSRLFQSLPNKFKPICSECSSSLPGEFKVSDLEDEKTLFEKKYSVACASQTLPFILEPKKTKDVRLEYTPLIAAKSSALLFIRNNMTILEVLHFEGRGAFAEFKFGNRKPGSSNPLLFELVEKHLKDCENESEFKRNSVPNITVKRSFTAKNTGELPINIYGFYINGLSCEGYGYKILNCSPFVLHPNDSRKIEIGFTPDFTLSRIERHLFISTSLGNAINSDTENDEIEGLVKLILLTTIPPHTLEACGKILTRPTWETALQWTAISLTFILLICVLAAAFLEADRILRGALVNLSRGNPTQPPLDLRLLSHSNNHEKEKQDKIKANNKIQDSSPDWFLMNVKRNKEKDSHKGIKIPDWSVEEERRFKIDTNSKDICSLKRCRDSLSYDNSNNMAVINNAKKRNNKRNNALETSESTLELSDKRNSSTKSSPTSNKKNKSIKDESKQLIDNEIENKKKHFNYNNSNTNSVNCKRHDSNTSQKNVHCSEEESCSTTSSSSTLDENAYKEYDNNCEKQDKSQKKVITKKNKLQNAAGVPLIDYKENYEGDSDDDYYDKERNDCQNEWKTNLTRSGIKQHIPRNNTDFSCKLSRQKPNSIKKDKVLLQRRKITDVKAQLKLPNGNPVVQIQETKLSPPLLPPVAAPPPAVCWGENRAKFSDVVAGNQDVFSPFSNYNNNKTRNMNHHGIKLPFNLDGPDNRIKNETMHYLNPFNDKSALNYTSPSYVNDVPLGVPKNNDSYFINSYKEPKYRDPNLSLYRQVPDAQVSRIGLDNIGKVPQSRPWHENDPLLNLPDSYYQMNQIRPIEKVPNPSNIQKDNWITVDKHWEPLYSRGAVGEERSGVWGINTGGVWAAAPWGAPTVPPLQSTCHLQPTKPTNPEQSSFDPFRSLSTIWTPSSSDTLTTKQKK